MDVLFNECVLCHSRWDVLEHVTIESIYLDDVDRDNLSTHGQLYCICEDCHGSYECPSVLLEDYLGGTEDEI
jgi:hypothetical protein